MEQEDPLSVNMWPKVNLNGKSLQASHGCGTTWNPCVSQNEYYQDDAKTVIEHYGLDAYYGWAIRRISFPWMTKRKPQITTLSVTLKHERTRIAGRHFHVSEPGDKLEFTHPITGEEYTLTVMEYEHQELEQRHFSNGDYEFPTHYMVMSYTLCPDLSDAELAVVDSASSERPREKKQDKNSPEGMAFTGCIGVIGGADGPTVIFTDREKGSKLHAACSALHFEPREDAEWCLEFREKLRDDISVELI